MTLANHRQSLGPSSQKLRSPRGLPCTYLNLVRCSGASAMPTMSVSFREIVDRKRYSTRVSIDRDM